MQTNNRRYDTITLGLLKKEEEEERRIMPNCDIFLLHSVRMSAIEHDGGVQNA